MKKDRKPPVVGTLLHHLQHNQELRHQPVSGSQSGPELDPQLAELRSWQSARLAHTYADLLADPRYRPACLFFLSDIYAPRDFSQRDHDLERIHAALSKILPATTLQLLSDTVELNALTNELDRKLVEAMAAALAGQPGQTAGDTAGITPQAYAAGYRLCDNYPERVHQIELIARVVGKVGEGARHKVVGAAMKLARVPAHRAGWVELYDYLERGYTAFRQMRDVENFVQAVEQREMRILDQIFAGHSDPFAID